MPWETLNIITGKKPRSVDRKETVPIGLGYERKNKVKATVSHGARTRAISLFERVYEEKSGALQHYIKMWELFKKADLPVVPTIRHSESNSLFLTDLTADGSHIYGKGLMYLLRSNEELLKYKSPTDKTFLKVLKNQFEDISAKALELAKRADSAGLLLPSDDPFELLISPNGDWKLVILDLTAAFQADSVFSAQDVQRTNEQSVQFFLSCLREVEWRINYRYTAFIRNIFSPKG